MRIIPVETIGSVPLEMFDDVRQGFREHISRVTGQILIRWLPDQNQNNFSSDIVELIDPLHTLILSSQRHELKYIDYNLRSEIIHPYERPIFYDREWHKDGDFADRASQYITASDLYTRFRYSRNHFNPGDVLRYNRAIHKAPTNETDQTIHRIWVRGSAHH